jgi:sugar phosphate isomerase/epimerase
VSIVKLAFSTNAFVRVNVETAIDSIAEAGYTGVELMLDHPHLFPAETAPSKIRAVRQTIEHAGLTISNCNAFPMSAIGDTWHPSWIEDSAEQRKLRIQHTADALRLARDLGAKTISTEPGGPLPQGMSREQALTLFIQGIAEVLPVAEETGVALLVEPEPGLLIEREDQYQGFARRISHDKLGMNFDIGHFFCVGEDPAEAFLALQPHVRHVHLEDIAATRKHRHLMPGEGAINLRGTVETILEAGYNGWITVELYPYQDSPFETACQAYKYFSEQNKF